MAEAKKHVLTKNGIYVTTLSSVKNFFHSLISSFGSKSSKVVIVKSKKKDLNQIKKWIDKDKFDTPIERTYSGKEIKEAYRHLESKRAKGKLVVVPNW